MGRLTRIFKGIKARKQSEEVGKAEIERITDQLIEETKQKLQKQFVEGMQRLGDDIIEELAVRNNLQELLNTAVAQRRLLIVRIEKDAEIGEIFDRYYSKMQVINVLTNSAYARMQKMKVIRARYEYEQEVYKKVIGKMYTVDLDDKSVVVDGNIRKVRIDPWIEMDDEAGHVEAKTMEEEKN